MKTKLILFALALCLISTGPAFALFQSYNYISAAEVKEKLAGNEPMTLVDIQVVAEFNQHHIDGAVATYAYPVKSDEDRAKLNASISALKENQNLAVIVCPRGGGGAKRAYDHLVESGIPESRVTILTKGQAEWPYPELLAAK